MIRGRKVRLHNGGTPIRNWLHADDTAEAVMSIIESENVDEIYNVAGGFEQTNADTVRKIVSAHHDTHDWKKYVDFSYSRQGQDVRYALNDDKLRSLGWAPKKVFDKEIKSVVEHYKTNFIW